MSNKWERFKAGSPEACVFLNGAIEKKGSLDWTGPPQTGPVEDA